MPYSDDTEQLLLGKPKLSLRYRILSAFKNKSTTCPRPLIRPTNVGLHLTTDPDRENNATHRLLPSEHISAWNQSRAQQHHSISSTPRILSGPVPRRGMTTLTPRQQLDIMERNMEQTFLTPVEQEVRVLIQGASKTSFFRPVLEPKRAILLVRPGDQDRLERVRDLVKDLPEGEKHMLARDLHRILRPEGLYCLRMLLFNEDVRVTAQTRGSKLGAHGGHDEEALQDEKIGKESQRSQGSGNDNDDNEGPTGPGRVNSLSISRKPVPERPRTNGLRGGGVADKQQNTHVYTDPHSKDISTRGKRVSKLLWWFAGGRLGRGRKAPTISEYQQLRQAATGNRHPTGSPGGGLGFMAKDSPIKGAKPPSAMNHSPGSPQGTLGSYGGPQGMGGYGAGAGFWNQQSGQ